MVDKVKHLQPKLGLSIMVLLLLGVAMHTMSTPPSEQAFYWDSQTTFNGQLVPLGSIIDVYDPQSVHCGKDTVELDVGMYGFMAVVGDDGTTPLVDEGAVTNDSLTFYINGHEADMTWFSPETGYRWQDKAVRQVRFDVPSGEVTVSVSPVSYARDTLAEPGFTVRLFARVRNLGNGLDFYSVTATSKLGWNIVPQAVYSYADPTDTALVYFDVDVPTWGSERFDTVSYSIFSNLDPTEKVDSSVAITKEVGAGVLDPWTSSPVDFELLQNYPNPFNPTTTIAFQLETRSEVVFSVFDVLGRRVEGRSLGLLSDGRHEVSFDGSNLSSGIYFYRLETDHSMQTRKMALIK